MSRPVSDFQGIAIGNLRLRTTFVSTSFAMKRLGVSMSRWGIGRLAGLTAISLALLSSPVDAARPKRESPLIVALRHHVETLASDDFGGREPGTEGETKTLRYLAGQWFDIGLESGTNSPASAWYAPVDLVEREPLLSRARFLRGRRELAMPADGVFVVTSGVRSLIENAPMLYVGRGKGGLTTRTELAGRIAVVFDSQAPARVGEKEIDIAGRLLDGGAAAVLTVLDGDRGIEDVVARRRRAGYALAGERLGGDIEAFASPAAAEMLLAGAGGGDLAALRRAGDAPEFAARLIGVNATFEATSRETRIKTHNLIGKLEGKRSDKGAVLMVAHWDHFGKCAAPPAEDLICNGAIDNASGLAVITETARLLSSGRQLDRDVYFLATTGEELGLLGALAFTENPPIPLDRFVAAFNVDSTGLVPAGLPVSVIGKGMTGLDPGIAKVVKALKRKFVVGNAANAFAKRQDSWVLLQHDVPTVMVSTSYSDPERLEKFMDNVYHRPNDDAAKVEYGGLADDVQLQAALVRYFADPRLFPRASTPGAGPTVLTTKP